MLLVADATQDVYGTAASWTDQAMVGAGFRGNWGQLSVSYRMPPLLITRARDFAQRFLPAMQRDLPVAEQGELDGMYPCNLRWEQVDRSLAAQVCAREVLSLSLLTGSDEVAITDTTFLCDNVRLGLEVVDRVEAKGVRVLDNLRNCGGIG